MGICEAICFFNQFQHLFSFFLSLRVAEKCPGVCVADRLSEYCETILNIEGLCKSGLRCCVAKEIFNGKYPAGLATNSIFCWLFFDKSILELIRVGTLLFLVPSNTTLVLFSDPCRAFCSDTVPCKGP